MFRLRRFVRFILIMTLVAAVFVAVGYYIITSDHIDKLDKYHRSITLGIETAVAGALFDATRTLEGPTLQYRVITLGTNQYLADIAAQYDTTLDVLRMANGLAPDVVAGSGQQLIVPQGVQNLIPPRRFAPPYVAVTGDTLEAIAIRNNLPLSILQEDNPILAQRGIIPGDIVFIAQLL